MSLGHNSGQANRQGFTLLELLVVLAIMAIAAGITAPRYATAAARRRVDSAAWRIARDLSLARTRARAVSATCTVTFQVASSTYIVSGETALNGGTADYTVRLGDEPFRSRLVSAAFGSGAQSSAQARFDGFGTPAGPGSVVVQCGDIQRTVTLEAETGEATIQ